MCWGEQTTTTCPHCNHSTTSLAYHGCPHDLPPTPNWPSLSCAIVINRNLSFYCDNCEIYLRRLQHLTPKPNDWSYPHAFHPCDSEGVDARIPSYDESETLEVKSGHVKFPSHLAQPDEHFRPTELFVVLPEDTLPTYEEAIAEPQPPRYEVAQYMRYWSPEAGMRQVSDWHSDVQAAKQSSLLLRIASLLSPKRQNRKDDRFSCLEFCDAIQTPHRFCIRLN